MKSETPSATCDDDTIAASPTTPTSPAALVSPTAPASLGTPASSDCATPTSAPVAAAIPEPAPSPYPIPEHWFAPVAIIWAVYALTCFTSIATNYAALWFVTDSTSSALAVAAVSVCSFLPQGLLSPLGGLAADRFNRKTIVIACNAFLAVVAVVMALVIQAGFLSFPLVLVMATLLSVRQAFRDPAFNALMPLLVPQQHLMRINMLDNLLTSASMILAPALGIFLFTTFGLQSVMALAACAAVASIGTFLLVKVPTVVSDSGLGIVGDFREGFAELRRNRGLLCLVAVISVGIMCYAPIDALLPLMVSQSFGGDGYAASLVAGLFGGGMLAGAALLMAAGERLPLTRVIAACGLVVGAGFAAAGLMPASCFAGFCASVFIAAAACAGFSGPTMTLLQKNVQPDKLGRVLGLFSSALALSMPIGSALGGPLAEVMGTPAFFVLDGVILVVLGIILFAVPSVRKLG